MEHLELDDRIYLKIKQMIFDQELEPGQKLVQEKLSNSLGISRSPLLKALQRLEAEMLVEKIPRRGMYVKRLTIQEIISVFQCRSVLEGLSARLSASSLNAGQIQQLKAFFLPFVGQKHIDVEAYSKADRAFHHQIMKWSGNTVILRLEVLNNIYLNAYQAGLLRPPEATLSEHFEIIEALENKDGALAEKLMRKHIDVSIAAFQEKMEESE